MVQNGEGILSLMQMRINNLAIVASARGTGVIEAWIWPSIWRMNVCPLLNRSGLINVSNLLISVGVTQSYRFVALLAIVAQF